MVDSLTRARGNVWPSKALAGQAKQPVLPNLLVLMVAALSLGSCAVLRTFEPQAGRLSSWAEASRGWLSPTESERLPMLQNASGGGTAQFTVLVPAAVAAEVLRVTVVPQSDKAGAAPRVKVSVGQPLSTSPTWRLAKIRVDNLVAKQLYRIVLDKKQPGQTPPRYPLDERLFPVPDVTDGALRFALGTCMNDESPYKDAAQRLVASLSKELPDFLLIAGDAVYVDS